MKIQSTAYLSKEEVAEILKQHLESKGFTVENLAFEMGTITTGYGYSERDEKVFKGVSFKTEIVK